MAGLGNLVLISRAWGDGGQVGPDLRRRIMVTETREAVLAGAGHA